jgi:hypothetical protein
MDSLFFELEEGRTEDGGVVGEGDENAEEAMKGGIKLEIGQDTGIDMFALSFEWWDRLRVIEGSPENIAAIKDALQTIWTKG